MTSRTLRSPTASSIRPVTEDQHRAIFEAEIEAFRDHWSSREKTDEDFARTFKREELDTDLWVVAWDGDEIAGVVQNWIWPEENETHRLGSAAGSNTSACAGRGGDAVSGGPSPPRPCAACAPPG